MADDRNLLVAVLALRENIINRSQFVEICELWDQRNGAPVIDLLIEKGWLRSEERARLERLFDAQQRPQAKDPYRTLQAYESQVIVAAAGSTSDAEAQVPQRDPYHTLQLPDTHRSASVDISPSGGFSVQGVVEQNPYRTYLESQIIASAGTPASVPGGQGQDPYQTLVLESSANTPARDPYRTLDSNTKLDVSESPASALDTRNRDSDPYRTLDASESLARALTDAPGSTSVPRRQELVGPESRYSMIRMHAEGGIGRIWLARDSQLNREVAVKELRPQAQAHARMQSRFLLEAQITGQLQHPGIVPVYELVQRPQIGQPFYAMRFVRGRTLAEAATAYHDKRLAGEADPLGLVSLLSAFVAVCNTVAYAHARGVIHRDLKGDNVILGDFGEVIVLDWGVAKVSGKADDMVGAGAGLEGTGMQTMDGDVVGTPAFMAPEQAEGRLDLIDSRTDIYGLGAILYEILTGEPPFVGVNTVELLHKVLREEPVRPSQLWPEVPPGLEAICLRAISKERSARHASASALAQEVQTWQEVQRRKAEEALRRQSEILQSILDNMGESVIVVDEQSKLLLLNPSAQRMLGVESADTNVQEALGRYPVFLPDQTTPYPRDDLPLRRTLRGEDVDDAELFVRPPDVPNGRWIQANARPLRDARGVLRGGVMVLRDITERKRAEEELRRSRERFELAVRGSQDGLWDWDLQTNEVYFSPRWKEIIGYEDHEIAHNINEWDIRLHPDERERVLAANYAHINGNTPHYEYEYRLRHKDGSYRWILARGVALRDQHGKAYRMAGSHVDITAWKDSEARYQAVVEELRKVKEASQ